MEEYASWISLRSREARTVNRDNSESVKRNAKGKPKSTPEKLRDTHEGKGQEDGGNHPAEGRLFTILAGRFTAFRRMSCLFEAITIRVMSNTKAAL